MSVSLSFLEWDHELAAAERDFYSAAMEWHFGPETGSQFWLSKADSLGFDPRRDVRTHADLRRFPNVVGELRNVPVEALIPRGYGDRPDVIGAFDSGGTTGAPKRVLLMSDWMRHSLTWKSLRMDELGFPLEANWLTIAPSGPHIFGRLMAEVTRMRGGICFTIDLDPRWVRKSLALGRTEEANRYAEHVVVQAQSILEQQDIGVLVVTPPLLVRMAESDRLVDLVNEKVSVIMWGGAHLDADTREVLQGEVFPKVRLCGQYGSTMILGGSMERAGSRTPPGQCVFDSFSPYTTFSVVDPDSLTEVAEGERGQVVMHHVSKSLLLPNNLERDLATRVAAPAGSLGVSVADVTPIAVFEDAQVIEGVY
ncbi:AMP-binding protein [Amycolatopsis regifaucium]|uniref:Phenazine antibiotic biosynthesis protein n=1 Tax=Amycolatopsis regifaucium TaxID=546365 RepID=A0A154MQY8_9PSEU|nr:AMP-binding protein [Amycolatopsis regifaucium]KZB86520.1 phenazine antibiotic biosynthesis protein [Amycolatopsis regifaucium]OKA03464.1 phenazine antibiotic biosynthesis protein [Amycolatopsis regifaucium]SFJ13871.1 AMP-binding enzyme [Amycolatopsis regifaucium]